MSSKIDEIIVEFREINKKSIDKINECFLNSKITCYNEKNKKYLPLTLELDKDVEIEKAYFTIINNSKEKHVGSFRISLIDDKQNSFCELKIERTGNFLCENYEISEIMKKIENMCIEINAIKAEYTQDLQQAESIIIYKNTSQQNIVHKLFPFVYKKHNKNYSSKKDKESIQILFRKEKLNKIDEKIKFYNYKSRAEFINEAIDDKIKKLE